jgi:translation initiation factor IF-3
MNRSTVFRSDVRAVTGRKGRSVCQVSSFSESAAISTNFRHNHQIRISPIRLINQNEEQVGIVSTSDALRMAQEAGLDLVEVAPTARPPVCRIMDYGKWRYQQQKKEDKSRASSKAGQLKELKFKTVKIGEHDLMIKINHAREFLKEGNKVQFTLQFRGREMAHQELGRDIFTKIKTELWPVSKVERDAKMEGRRMTLVLQPDHKAPGTKPPAVSTGRPPAGSLPPPPPVGGPTRRGGDFSGAGQGLNLPPRQGAGPVGPRQSVNPVANLPVGPRQSVNPVANLPVSPRGSGPVVEPVDTDAKPAQRPSAEPVAR